MKTIKVLPSFTNGRGPSTTSIKSPQTCQIGPITRVMAKKLQEDWNTATGGRETYLYMLKDVIASSVE